MLQCCRDTVAVYRGLYRSSSDCCVEGGTTGDGKYDLTAKYLGACFGQTRARALLVREMQLTKRHRYNLLPGTLQRRRNPLNDHKQPAYIFFRRTGMTREPTDRALLLYIILRPARNPLKFRYDECLDFPRAPAYFHSFHQNKL